MFGLSAAMAIVSVLAVYVGATVQASVGIGLGMIASPVLALADPAFIPVTIVIAVIPLTVSMALAERAHVDQRGFVLAVIGRVPGVVLGAILVAAVGDRVLALLVACSVLAAVIASVAGWHVRTTGPTIISAGLASGFTGTATGVGGPPMAIVYQHGDPATMRSTISAFFAVGAAMSVTALWVAGQIGSHQLELTLLILPPVLLGALTGRLVKGRLHPAVVRPAVLGLCSLASVTLLVGTLF
jgi:uncharacterized membrane protein YfcA